MTIPAALQGHAIACSARRVDRRQTGRARQDGVALVIVVMSMLLLSAVGAALVLVTSADVLIAANVGASNEALYAADAAFERTVGELRDATDLTSVLGGAVVSAFEDGPPAGQRTLADGTRVDLSQIVFSPTVKSWRPVL